MCTWSVYPMNAGARDVLLDRLTNLEICKSRGAPRRSARIRLPRLPRQIRVLSKQNGCKPFLQGLLQPPIPITFLECQLCETPSPGTPRTIFSFSCRHQVICLES